MTADFRNRAGTSGSKPYNANAGTSGVLKLALGGLVLAAGLTLGWLSWPFAVQELTDLSADQTSGPTQVEGRRFGVTLGGATVAESAQNGAAQSWNANDDALLRDGEFLDADDVAAALGISDENRDTSAAGRQRATASAADDIDASREESDEEPDAEPQLLPISGWVLDQQGEAVGHMEVTASARRLAQEQRTSAGGKATTLADESGYFAFGELPDGEYLLETEATEDYDSARTTVRTGVSSALLRVTGDAGTPVTIQGTVTDAQGQPISGARVAPTDEAQATTSNGAGSYSLVLTVDDRARSRALRFTKQDYRGKTEAIAQAQLRDAGDYRLDVQLDAEGGGVTVQGRVLSQDLDPIPGARVQLSSRQPQRGHTTTTASDGSFVLEDVAAGGGYRLWVRPRADFEDYVEEGLAVAGGGQNLAVYLDPLGQASLSGRMINSFGEPVPRHTLWMWNGGAGANRSLAVTGKSDGSFQVKDVPAGEVTFGSRGHPQFNLAGIRLESGQSTSADLVLDWGREELAGVVVDDDGDPVAGAQVTLLWSDVAQAVTSHSKRRTVTDAGGYFIFTELGPGWHTVTVSAKGYRAVRREEMPSMSGGEISIQLQETAS